MSAPSTCYNIEVVQFWRGQKEYLRPYPHIIGNTDTYTIEFKRNQPHANPDDWRGSFTVGRVAAHQLALLERHLASVPITHHDSRWNSQNWVWDCLHHLRRQRFEISWHLRQCDLQTMMCTLLEEWEFGRI
ncbi:hypothetical protein BD769DRAFT_1448163 [Suillus cothurnatus]|nr:hypothetical protein BD769DRAFT_1448163 [Suillus cothurnatus]